MDVRVDQPRHQDAARQIDRLGNRTLDRPVRYLADVPSLDEHMAVLAPFPAGAVEHRATGKSERGHENLPLAALLC